MAIELDEKMRTIEEIQSAMIQGQRDSDLASLLFITRQLGKFEGIISTQAVPDHRIASAKDDLLQVSERLIEKVGLSESMRLQEQELEKDHFGDDHY